MKGTKMMAALLASVALVGGACSKDSSSAVDTGAPAPTESSASAATNVDATVKDFSITLSVSEGATGEVKFNISNEGPSVHEFVVIKSDIAADALTLTEGLVPEDTVEVIGEAEDIQVGDDPSVTLTLDAGNYVIICNIVGHYESGMHAAFTVA